MRIRFRLRTALIVVALLALPMEWYGRHWSRDRQLQARVTAIEKLGGQVMFDLPADSASIDAKLWRIVGWGEGVERPASIVLSGNPRIDDAGLAALSLETFPALESLTLDGCRISDQSMGVFEKLTDLTDLSLANTKITDRTLTAIGRLRQLTSLDLSRTDITDAGLNELIALQHLETLNVRDTGVTRRGIAKLQSAIPETLINRNARH